MENSVSAEKAIVAEAEPAKPPITKTVDRPPAKAVRTTVKVADLLKVETKKEVSSGAVNIRTALSETFTTDQLKAAWSTYTASRKKFQAEFQLLSQPYDVEGPKVILHLLSPVQETMLASFRVELTTFLREQLKNDSILVNGLLRETDEKKMMYTSRDKFEYLQEKIPVLKELKERLGLDTDF